MKKAMALTEIATMVFVAVSLLIVLGIILALKTGVDNFTEDSECKANIAAHSNLLRTSGEAAVADIYCPTKYYTQKAENSESLNKAMAESLRTCWATWGAGQLQLFKDQGLYCHVCSTVKFSDKDVNSNDFQNYLKNAIISEGSGKGSTYAEYLHYTTVGDVGDEEKALAKLDQPISLDTSKEYATLFMYAKGKNAATQLFEALGGGVAITGGAVSGSVVGTAAGFVVAGGLALVSGGSIPVAIVVIGGATGATGGGVFAWLKARETQSVAITIITEYTADNLKQLNCQVAPTRQDKQKETLG